MRISVLDLKNVAAEIIEKVFEFKEKETLKAGTIGEMGPAIKTRLFEKQEEQRHEERI